MTEKVPPVEQYRITVFNQTDNIQKAQVEDTQIGNLISSFACGKSILCTYAPVKDFQERQRQSCIFI